LKWRPGSYRSIDPHPLTPPRALTSHPFTAPCATPRTYRGVVRPRKGGVMVGYQGGERGVRVWLI
jgi:hypothetical protein